jgi:hypothetical protein
VSKCRHKSTRHRYWRDGAWCGVVYGVNAAEWISTNDGSVVCQDCGAWLSLGPANDDSDAVRIEIRAAELAARRGFGSFSNCGAGCERCGFVSFDRGTDGTPICKRSQFDTGFLARAILDHRETA